MASGHDWFIDLRANSRGGPVGTLKITDGAGKIFSTDELLSEVRGQDVLLMAHGYNVSLPHGRDSLNIFKRALTPPAPLFIGVLWPGDCILPIFVDYIWEGGEANKSGDLLGDFIAKEFTRAASVSLASHSLGARVVLRALSRLPKDFAVRQLILLAAAIEDDALTSSFAAAADHVEHISVVASHKDEVLQLAYPPGNLLGTIVDREHPNVKTALGREGPLNPRPNIWPTQRLPDGWNYGHTDYLSGSALGGAFPLPVDVPSASATNWPDHTPAAVQKSGWKPCWSPAFVSTRWHRG